VQHAVDPEQTRVLVELVTSPSSLGDLDDRAEVTLDMIAELDVVATGA